MMAKGRNVAGEASVEPASSASERETLDALVASFSRLDRDQLRLQWRNHLGGVAPAHLPNWLIMRVLAYPLQSFLRAKLATAKPRLRRLHLVVRFAGNSNRDALGDALANLRDFLIEYRA